MLPDWFQAIICTNAEWFIWTFGNKFQWNSNQNSMIFIIENDLENLLANRWPFCLGLNVLRLFREAIWHHSLLVCYGFLVEAMCSEWDSIIYRLIPAVRMVDANIFQSTDKIFCVEFQRVPLKFHTKYLSHRLKDVDFIHWWKFKSS